QANRGRGARARRVGRFRYRGPEARAHPRQGSILRGGGRKGESQDGRETGTSARKTGGQAATTLQPPTRGTARRGWPAMPSPAAMEAETGTGDPPHRPRG